MSSNSRTPIAWQHRDMNFYQNSYGRQSAVDRHSLSQGGAASGSTSDRRSSSRSGTGGGGDSNRYQRGRPGTGVGPPPPHSATTDTTPTSLSSDSATETETTVGEGRMSVANNGAGRMYYTPLPPHLQQQQEDGTLRSSASMQVPMYMGHGPGMGSMGQATLDGAPCPVHHHEAVVAGSVVGTLGRDPGGMPPQGQPIYAAGDASGLYMPLSVASFPRRAASVYDMRMAPPSLQPYGTLPMHGYDGMGPPSLVPGPPGPFSLPPPPPPGVLTLRNPTSTSRSRASRKRQAASMMVLPLLMPGPPPQLRPPPPRRPVSPIPPHLLPPMMRPRPLVMPAPAEGASLAPEPLPMRDPEKGGVKTPTPVPTNSLSKAMHQGLVGSSGASKLGSVEKKQKKKIQCCKGHFLVMWIILGIVAFGILLATVLSITIG